MQESQYEKSTKEIRNRGKAPSRQKGAKEVAVVGSPDGTDDADTTQDLDGRHHCKGDCGGGVVGRQRRKGRTFRLPPSFCLLIFL